MLTMSQPKVVIRTAADLLYELGDIPAERVLITPPPGTATEKDLLDLLHREKRLCELADGVLVQKADTGFETSPDRPTKVRTLADLLHDLGDVSPDRVLVDPPIGTATDQDVVDLDDHEDRICELMDGVLVEKIMGVSESFLAMLIGTILNAFVLPRKLGVVLGEAGMLRMRSKKVQVPDISFISRGRLPGGKRPKDAVWRLAPDLAVEVLSKGNSRSEMLKKRKEYFASGTILVWEFDPRKRLVKVYKSPTRPATRSEHQSLSGDPVLPGLTISLAELFSQYDEI
jgi:Uma2 family endonuclease